MLNSQYVGNNQLIQLYNRNHPRSLLQNDSDWHADREIFKNLEKASKINFDNFLKIILSRNCTNTSQASRAPPEQETPITPDVVLDEILQIFLRNVLYVAIDSTVREALATLCDLYTRYHYYLHL